MTEHSGLWQFVRREPLVHFLGIAVLLFVANAVFVGDTREAIIVDLPAQEFLIDQRQDLVMQPLSETEKAAAIENYIEQEILVREARKRGFENSSRVRELLIQNMRFFITSDIPHPTDDELLVFFNENPDIFQTEASITYESSTFTDPGSVPVNTLEMLREGADYRTLGDTNARTSVIRNARQDGLIAIFGREQAKSILAITDDLWHGPFTTTAGVHFLRVRERHEATRPDFEYAVSWIKQEWLSQRTREVMDREMEKMRQNYRLEIEQATTGSE